MIEKVEALWNQYIEMTAFPKYPEFKKLKENAIVDENQTVAWNREEVRRINDAYKTERNRLIRAKNVVYNEIVDTATQYIAEETGCSPEQSETIFNFFKSDIFETTSDWYRLDDLIEFVNKLIWK